MNWVAGSADRGTRLDRFVSRGFEDASRSLVSQWIRSGRVSVDGEVVRKPARRLRGHEVVTARPAPRPPLRARPEDIEVRVLHEDEHLAVIDKSAGMAVHAGAGRQSGTLVNALLHRFDRLSGASGPARPGIVHRLDRFTSGAMVVAKSDRAHRRLQEQFRRREVVKRYWAAVEGRLPAKPHLLPRLLRRGRPVQASGAWWLRIELPIRRDKRNRVRMAASAAGRPAVSDVRRLRGGERYSLAEVRIHTGRTHQVRVHLASVGHPVVGDSLYGARRKPTEAPCVERFLLHSRRLEFRHPETGAVASFTAPLPPDFESVLPLLGL